MNIIFERRHLGNAGFVVFLTKTYNHHTLLISFPIPKRRKLCQGNPSFHQRWSRASLVLNFKKITKVCVHFFPLFWKLQHRTIWNFKLTVWTSKLNPSV